MKKLILAAMMVLGTTAAFAGDSDALKAVLKAKNYAEAEALVKQSLSSMANDAEKAKAYNYLVDLAMKDFNDQQSVQQMNQLTKKNDPVNFDVMYDGAYNALQNALECDKYDQLPNEKGKVKPRFSSNKDRVWGARIQLVNAGQEAAQKNEADKVLKYWGAFLDTENAPLFADKAKEKEGEKEYLGQVAIFAARYAYQAKDLARCEKYCDIAMGDASQAKDALNLKLYVMKDGLKTQADSLAYVEKLKGLYAKDESNEVILDNLNTMYSSMKMEKEQLDLLNTAIANNPKNFVALADMGMYYIGKNDADNAIKNLKAALEIQPENVVVMTYLGACLNVKASNLQDPNGRKVVYTESIKYLDKAKELDPEKAQANWGYNRYQAYYGLYGPNDPKTKEAENESH